MMYVIHFHELGKFLKYENKTVELTVSPEEAVFIPEQSAASALSRGFIITYGFIEYEEILEAQAIATESMYPFEFRGRAYLKFKDKICCPRSGNPFHLSCKCECHRRGYLREFGEPVPKDLTWNHGRRRDGKKA